MVASFRPVVQDAFWDNVERQHSQAFRDHLPNFIASDFVLVPRKRFKAEEKRSHR